MKTQNQNFQNSLRCLQHPLSLIGIAVLLLNDHVLKVVSPSWLTGKLSDFAGLFFFPFVVAACLSIILNRFEFSARGLGLIAFGLTSICFASLKIIVPINNLGDEIASLFYGVPIHYALDPTDLLALAVLIPASRLWIQQRGTKPTKLAYIALAVGSFAAIATSSIEWAVTNVTDLSYSKDRILYAADRESFGVDSYPVAKSLDGGVTWEKDTNITNLPAVKNKIYPVQVCSSLNHCYRITGNHELELQIFDGTWTKVFSSGGISVKANDAVIITWEEKEYLLIAIGKSGILRRELPDGNWEIIGVINARW